MAPPKYSLIIVSFNNNGRLYGLLCIEMCTNIFLLSKRRLEPPEHHVPNHLHHQISAIPIVLCYPNKYITIWLCDGNKRIVEALLIFLDLFLGQFGKGTVSGSLILNCFVSLWRFNEGPQAQHSHGKIEASSPS